MFHQWQTLLHTQLMYGIPAVSARGMCAASIRPLELTHTVARPLSLLHSSCKPEAAQGGAHHSSNINTFVARRLYTRIPVYGAQKPEKNTQVYACTQN